MDKEADLFRLIGLTGTVSILRHLNEHGPTRHKDLMELVNTHSLNERIRMLLHFNLIEHHLEMGDGRKQKRREWYTITEKGRKVLMYMEKIAEL